MMTTIRTVAVLSVLSILAGCSGTKVTRVAANSTIDLSGKWNDADSRMVSEELLKDCLDHPWYQAWQTTGKVPTVVVGEMRNRSNEHINMETFVNDLQRVLVNSGKVDFVATEMYWPITHMVAAKDKALGCAECHAKGGRLEGIEGVYLPGRDANPWIDRAGWLLARLGRPAMSSAAPERALLAVLLLLAAGALAQLAGADRAGWRVLWLGHSAPICPVAVLVLAVPALALAFAALRGLAPVRPRAAGAAAGLLAGALGAAGYALTCNELGLAFVLTWYTLGMALAAALGALLGPRVLRW